MTLLHSTATMDLRASAWLYYTLLGSYLAPHDSSTLYHGSTWLYLTLPHPIMPLPASTIIYCTLPWLYLPLLYSTTFYHGFTSLYLTLLHALYYGSTCLYTWLYPLPWLYSPLLHPTITLLASTRLYYTLPWLYLSLYLALPHSTMAILAFIKIWSVVESGIPDQTLLHSWMTLYYLPLCYSTTHYYGSTCVYWTLLHSSMALLASTTPYRGPTSHYLTLPYTLPWLYFLYLTLLHSTMALLPSTWLYCTLPHSTIALFDST